jgi:S1-C subfamily serine protease
MSHESLTLSAVSDQLAQAVDHVAQSVVAVHARERLASTGVHWRDDLVVTTAATVRRDSGIALTLPSGERVDATLVGHDPVSDLAVLRSERLTSRPATLGDSTTLRAGHLALAVARLDAHGPRVAFGAVSRVGGPWRSWKGAEYAQQLQTGLTLYPGFGGSPLVDPHGRVHGINSGGLSQTFATTIPRADVDRVVAQLLTTGYVARGWLGAAMQIVRLPEPRAAGAASRESGLLVVGLADGGPAARSGLLVGDILLRVEQHDVNEPRDVLDWLDRTAPGATLRVDLLRGGVPTSVIVTVGERPRGTGRTRRPAGRRS